METHVEAPFVRGEVPVFEELYVRRGCSKIWGGVSRAVFSAISSFFIIIFYTFL